MSGQSPAVPFSREEAAAKLALLMPALRILRNKLIELESKFSALGRNYPVLLARYDNMPPSEVPVTELAGFLDSMRTAAQALEAFEISERFSIGDLPADMRHTYTLLRDHLSQSMAHLPESGEITPQTVLLGNPGAKVWDRSAGWVLEGWGKRNRYKNMAYSCQAWEIIEPRFHAVGLIERLEKETGI